MYQIKATSSLTGLNAETLRAWERRYKVVIPQRDDKGRRLYSEQDIERLTLLNQAIRKGHTIGKIACLNNSDLQKLVKESLAGSTLNKDLFNVQVLDALMKYRLDTCEDLLRRALIAMDPLSYAKDLLIPTLQRVGELWHNNKLTIAQEHMFSNCAKRILLSMIHNRRPFDGHHARLIFATLSGEQHEFGILLACMVAAEQRFCCFYLGTEIPADELVKTQNQLEADAIVLGFVNNPPADSMLQQLRFLDDCLGNRTRIWVGGAGAQQINENKSVTDRFRILTDLDDFYSQLKLLNIQKQGQ